MVRYTCSWCGEEIGCIMGGKEYKCEDCPFADCLLADDAVPSHCMCEECAEKWNKQIDDLEAKGLPS